jgi:hypothetical protein
MRGRFNRAWLPGRQHTFPHTSPRACDRPTGSPAPHASRPRAAGRSRAEPPLTSDDHAEPSHPPNSTVATAACHPASLTAAATVGRPCTTSSIQTAPRLTSPAAAAHLAGIAAKVAGKIFSPEPTFRAYKRPVPPPRRPTPHQASLLCTHRPPFAPPQEPPPPVRRRPWSSLLAPPRSKVSEVEGSPRRPLPSPPLAGRGRGREAGGLPPPEPPLPLTGGEPGRRKKAFWPKTPSPFPFSH